MDIVVTQAEVGPDDVLGLRLSSDRGASGARELVLRRRRSGDERRMHVGSAGGSVALAQLDLTPGLWDCFVLSGGETSRLPTVDPGFSYDRLDAYATGRHAQEFLAYRTTTGYFALRVREAVPAADVRAVWIRESRLEVTGMLVYAGLYDDGAHHEAHLIAEDGKHGRRLSAEATVEGVRFHAALSLVDVAAAAETPGDWQLLLTLDEVGRELRLGAYLDDVAARQRQTRYPAATIDGISLRPAYGAGDDLLLEAR